MIMVPSQAPTLGSHPSVPSQGPTLGSHLRVSSQGPTLRFHPRVPFQGPTLGSNFRVASSGPTLESHSRVLGSGSQVPLFRYPLACSFIKKRLQYRCFPVKFVKFLRAPPFIEQPGGCFHISNKNSTQPGHNSLEQLDKEINNTKNYLTPGAIKNRRLFIKNMYMLTKNYGN